MPTTNKQLHNLLGPEADALLSYKAKGFSADRLHLPGPDFVDRVISITDRPPDVRVERLALHDADGGQLPCELRIVRIGRLLLYIRVDHLEE